MYGDNLGSYDDDASFSDEHNTENYDFGDEEDTKIAEINVKKLDEIMGELNINCTPGQTPLSKDFFIRAVLNYDWYHDFFKALTDTIATTIESLAGLNAEQRESLKTQASKFITKLKNKYWIYLFEDMNGKCDLQSFLLIGTLYNKQNDSNGARKFVWNKSKEKGFINTRNMISYSDFIKLFYTNFQTIFEGTTAVNSDFALSNYSDFHAFIQISHLLVKDRNCFTNSRRLYDLCIHLAESLKHLEYNDTSSKLEIFSITPSVIKEVFKNEDTHLELSKEKIDARYAALRKVWPSTFALLDKAVKCENSCMIPPFITILDPDPTFPLDACTVVVPLRPSFDTNTSSGAASDLVHLPNVDSVDSKMTQESIEKLKSNIKESLDNISISTSTTIRGKIDLTNLNKSDVDTMITRTNTEIVKLKTESVPKKKLQELISNLTELQPMVPNPPIEPFKSPFCIVNPCEPIIFDGGRINVQLQGENIKAWWGMSEEKLQTHPLGVICSHTKSAETFTVDSINCEMPIKAGAHSIAQLCKNIVVPLFLWSIHPTQDIDGLPDLLKNSQPNMKLHVQSHGTLDKEELALCVCALETRKKTACDLQDSDINKRLGLFGGATTIDGWKRILAGLYGDFVVQTAAYESTVTLCNVRWLTSSKQIDSIWGNKFLQGYNSNMYSRIGIHTDDLRTLFEIFDDANKHYNLVQNLASIFTPIYKKKLSEDLGSRYITLKDLEEFIIMRPFYIDPKLIKKLFMYIFVTNESKTLVRFYIKRKNKYLKYKNKYLKLKDPNHKLLTTEDISNMSKKELNDKYLKYKQKYEQLKLEKNMTKLKITY